MCVRTNADTKRVVKVLCGSGRMKERMKGKKYAYMTFLVGHIVRYIANFSDSIVHGVII